MATLRWAGEPLGARWKLSLHIHPHIMGSLAVTATLLRHHALWSSLKAVGMGAWVFKLQ